MSEVLSWFTPEVIWFLLGLAMLLAELAAPGLIIGFFGAGAWIVALVCLVLDISLNTQLAIFLITSLLSLALLRRRLRALIQGDKFKFNNLEDMVDDYIGRTVTVTKEIAPHTPGRVEFHGTTWVAVADEALPEGATVEIVAKDNITLKVKAI